MAMETTILVSIIAFIAYLSFLSAITPVEFRVMSPFDFTLLTTSLIGVAGSCAVATGLPCAGALVVFGFVNILGMFVTGFSWVKTLIFTPISVVLIYLALRIARGGG